MKMYPISNKPTADDVGPLGVCVYFTSQGLPRMTHISSAHRWFNGGLDAHDRSNGVIVHGWIPGSQSDNLAQWLNENAPKENSLPPLDGKRRIRIDED